MGVFLLERGVPEGRGRVGGGGMSKANGTPVGVQKIIQAPDGAQEISIAQGLAPNRDS